jgi:predicted phage terminase large subunit-like protein
MAKVSEAILRDEAKCASSLVFFRQRYLAARTDVAPAAFHHRWSDILLHGRSHYAAEGFRESGKDQIVVQGNLLHALTYPLPDRRYLVTLGANQTLASAKLRDVTRQFQARDRTDLRFDVEKIIEDSGQAFQVLYRDGLQIRIEAYGKGASIRGLVWGTLRPDILILNDIQDKDDMDSPTVLEKDWNWFLSDCMFLGNSTRIFMIGNNMGESCIIERVFASARSLGFVAERFPIADDAYQVATWPERFPIEAVLAEREGYRAIGKLDIWERERMCRAMAAESRPLHVEELRYYDEYDHSVAGAAIITMVDPAISLKSAADPSVIATVAIQQSGEWDILEMDWDRRDSVRLVDDIFRAVSRWGPQSVGVENVAAQEFLAQQIETEQKRRGVFFNLVRVTTRQNKISKITGRLQPRFRTGAIRVPKHASWLGAFLDEIRSYPTGEHDDMLDALAMIDDARSERLVPAFDASTCVAAEIPIPAHWPVWGALVPDPSGEAVMLWLACSPEGALYVIDQVFASVSPEELFRRAKKVLGSRKLVGSMAAPDVLWKETPISGQPWARTFISAGFRLRPGPTDWERQIANLNRLFSAPQGSTPKLRVFPRCKRLLWELYNAAAGEQKERSRKSIQALLLILSLGPRWRDMDNEPVRSGRSLEYPKADVP